MRKAFKIIGICILLCLIIQTVRMYSSGNNIQEYTYLALDNSNHTNNELPKSPIIFVYFSTECGFCEKTIIELSKLHNVNRTINFVFITRETDIVVVKKFVVENKMDELTSFIYIDPKDNFPMDFGLGMTYSTPTILVYNNKGKFVKEVKNYKDIIYLKSDI